MQDAFWCLCALIEDVLGSGYFDERMVPVQVGACWWAGCCCFTRPSVWGLGSAKATAGRDNPAVQELLLTERSALCTSALLLELVILARNACTSSAALPRRPHPPTPGLLQVDVLVFGHLLQGRFPTLWSHLQALDVDAASVTMHWFLCCFLNSLPLDSTLRGEAGGKGRRCYIQAVSLRPKFVNPTLPLACFLLDAVCSHLTHPDTTHCAPTCLASGAVWDQLFFEGSPVVLFRVALALVEIYDQVWHECTCALV